MIFKITTCTCELLNAKIEESPTDGDFENFDPYPQLDIKFWNPEEFWWKFLFPV